jgi:type II secretory pathway pseudopilin PulG
VKGPALRRSQGAFTLLEVLLAAMITGLVAFGIFGFVQANLNAMRVSKEMGGEQASMQSLMKLLQAQMYDVSYGAGTMLTGEAHKFNDLSSDEMQWICGAGLGLFTRHATGQYAVTLALKPTKDQAVCDLGVRREIVDGSSDDKNWLPLMHGVSAMEIRYFDRRLNAWLEKWTDRTAMPSLVRLRIWRSGNKDPYEQILTMPPSKSNS